jgi:ATP adenylyltransferase
MQKKYRAYMKRSNTTICYFCKLDEPEAPQPLHTYKHFYVAKNQFGYEIWDACKVLDHLMLIPKQHREGMSAMTKEELAEMAAIVAEYEKRGYTFYGRASETVTGSVPHQHTHFIRLEKKRRSWVVYLRKPHVLLSK